jgi:hypothetical protein
VFIINNTIALNDNYATAARAFGNGDPTQAQNSVPGSASRIATSSIQNGAGIAAYVHSAPFRALFGNSGGPSAHNRYSNPTITNSVVVGNRRYNWTLNYNANTGLNGQGQYDPTCRYDNTNSLTPNSCFGLVGPALTSDANNDIAVLGGGASTLRLAPTYSVFTNTSQADGTNGTQNRSGTPADFQRAYANGANGATGAASTTGSLAQLVFAVEQSVVKGAPVLEVQEPTVATTAAAFDEGGNFIDVRFGPLTRGYCNPALTDAACTQAWQEFAIYNPTATAAARTSTSCSGVNGGAGGDFRCGNRIPADPTNYATTRLQSDRNGVPRPTTNAGNWIRGAFAQ